ncbi:MAG TPA: SHOCT domain-containing protein [Anaerolineaceae bacterium]|nr:SHOCT domain-containing protein [Anaerolineaceae bacterium]
MKNWFGAIAVLAAFGTGAYAQAEKITVAVYDFLIPSVSVRSYQQERVKNPLEARPESLLTPAQMDKLPEEDRLAAMRQEQQELERWQAKKQQIELDRYNDHMNANKSVRDQLIKSDEGRAIIQASGMMESELGKYPAVFQIKRKRGGENANRDLNLENAVLGRNAPEGGENMAPTHYVEGLVGDLSVRELAMTDGPTSVETRLYRLPVKITLYEMASDTVAASYNQEVTTRDQSAGFAPKERREIMQELLRKATQEAAALMNETMKPAPAPVAASSGPSPIEKMKQLKDMLDGGLITQDEYDTKRAAILGSM